MTCTVCICGTYYIIKDMYYKDIYLRNGADCLSLAFVLESTNAVLNWLCKSFTT